MKMKKMAATLLAGIMVLSLTACSSSNADTLQMKELKLQQK